MKQNSKLMECIVSLVCYWYCSTTVSSTLPSSPTGFWHSSVSPNTVYHHLPKKQEGKTLLNRATLTRHYLVFFNNAHIKYFWLVPKKKKNRRKKKKEKQKPHWQIECLVSPNNKPINYILSKPDKQRQLFAVISLWKGQDSCSPLLYVLYWECYPHFLNHTYKRGFQDCLRGWAVAELGLMKGIYTVKW